MHTPTEHGTALSGVIERTLADMERVAPGTRVQDLCVIAEAIIEGAPEPGTDWHHSEWQVVYDAAREGSPRYAAASRALTLARARAAQVAA